MSDHAHTTRTTARHTPGISTAPPDPNSHISDPSLVDADKDTDKDADKQATTETPRVHGSSTAGGLTRWAYQEYAPRLRAAEKASLR